ncbi:unnamed protein product [Schistosoma margrebowiei]|uniref:Uncharacterized protein n=1 Tax=Schistosoma margrebowiei TaxID=48269 RepID=A0A183LHT1_9TREM|nr:unnamed protein product [Schistosoma margrebowiei]
MQRWFLKTLFLPGDIDDSLLLDTESREAKASFILFTTISTIWITLEFECLKILRSGSLLSSGRRFNNIVTGSNKGIGYSIVEKLAEFYGSSGEWDIYLTGKKLLVDNLTARNVELGQEAVEKLSKKGLDVKFHQLDITDRDSRKAVVNVSSSVSLTSLKKLSDDLYEKFVSPINLLELRTLISEFVKSAEDGTYSEKGWPQNAYGVSKIGLTKASFIFGEMLKDDPRGIVINSCCPGYCDTDMTSHKGTKTADEGSDTPFYLATLPIGSKEPINQFVYERKVVRWSK